MAMQLHPNWRNILLYAWSVRFLALAGVLNGGVVYLQMAAPYSKHSPFLFSLGAAFCTVAAFASRLIAQQKLKNDAPHA